MDNTHTHCACLARYPIAFLLIGTCMLMLGYGLIELNLRYIGLYACASAAFFIGPAATGIWSILSRQNPINNGDKPQTH